MCIGFLVFIAKYSLQEELLDNVLWKDQVLW